MEEGSSSPASEKVASVGSISSKTDDRVGHERSPLYSWDTKMVEKWLVEEDLKDYIPLFRDRVVGGPALLKMDYDSLKLMGVMSVSDRSRILSAIKFANRACTCVREGNTNGNVPAEVDETADLETNSPKGRRSPGKHYGSVGGKLQLKKKIEERFNAFQMLSSKFSAPREFVFSRIASSKSAKSSNSSSQSLSLSNNPISEVSSLGSKAEARDDATPGFLCGKKDSSSAPKSPEAPSESRDTAIDTSCGNFLDASRRSSAFKAKKPMTTPLSPRRAGAEQSESDDCKQPILLEIPTSSPQTQCGSSKSLPCNASTTSSNNSPASKNTGEKTAITNTTTSRSDSLSSTARFNFILKTSNGTPDQRNASMPQLSPVKYTPIDQDSSRQTHPKVPHRSDSLTQTFKHLDSRKRSVSSIRVNSQSDTSPTNIDPASVSPSNLRPPLALPEHGTYAESYRKRSIPSERAPSDAISTSNSREDSGSLTNLQSKQDGSAPRPPDTPKDSTSGDDPSSGNERERRQIKESLSEEIRGHDGHTISMPCMPKSSGASSTSEYSKLGTKGNPLPSHESLSDFPRANREGSSTENLKLFTGCASGSAEGPSTQSPAMPGSSGNISQDSDKNKSSSIHLSSASDSSFPVQAYIGECASVSNCDYIGERPPDEMIVDQLERYFPGIEDELYTPTEDDANRENVIPPAPSSSPSASGDSVAARPTRANEALYEGVVDTSKKDNGHLQTSSPPKHASSTESELKSISPIRDTSKTEASSPTFYHEKLEQNDHRQAEEALDTPIPKRNMDLESAAKASKNYAFRKSVIQNRAQSAIISKRISRLAKRRVTGGNLPVQAPNNYNADLIPGQDSYAPQKSSVVEVPNKYNYKINQRSSSIRMSKFHPRPLNLKSDIFADRSIDRDILNFGEPDVTQNIDNERSVFDPRQYKKTFELKDEDLRLDKLSIDQEIFPLVPAKPQEISKQDQIYDVPTLKRDRGSFTDNENEYEGNDLRDVLSNMLEGYQNEANTRDASDLDNYGKDLNISENIRKRVSLKVPDKTSDSKTLDIYGAMKTYECTEKRNTLISSRFSTDPQQNMPVGFKWRLGKVIGRGAFGTVYIGINLTTGDLMAVKQVNFGNGANSTLSRRRRQEESIKREIGFLKELQHDHIVAYYGCASVDNTFNVFLEYVSGGSIASCLTKYGAFADSCVRCFTAQILFGLEYLHSVNIIHRDIKGANVLIDSDGIAKISDFGISKRNQYNQAYHRVTRMSMQGTVPWMAPEVTRGKGYSAKVDIWSLGCLVLEMLTNRNPWYKVEGSVIYLLGKGRAPPIPAGLSPGAKEFLSKCFNDNPELRPTATQILNDPNGYPDTQNPVSFDFKKWIEEIMPKKVNEEKYNANTFDSTQSHTLNAS